MKKFIYLTAFTLLITSLAVTQPVGEDGGTSPDDEEPREQPTAVCGDGVCQPELEGICPEDCQEETGTEESSDGSEGEELNEEETENNNLLNPLTVSLAVGSVVFIFSTVILGLKMRKNQEEDEEDEESQTKKVEREIRKYKRQGYEMGDIITHLQNQGYDSIKLKNARENIEE